MKKIIVTTAVIVFSMAIIAYAAPDSNSIVKDDIEYYMQTDKSVYNLGEEVQMLYRVTNLGEEDVTFNFTHIPEWNFWVEKNGETIFRAVNGWRAEISEFTLSFSESKEFPLINPSYLWNMEDYEGNLVNAGEYNVIGGLFDGYYNYNHTKVSVPIEIIPNKNCKIVDEIEYCMQTDKHTYHLGGNVEMLYRVTNLGEEDVILGWVVSDPLNYYKFRVMQGDNQIWECYHQTPVASFEPFHLDPYESREFQSIWNMVNDNGTPWLPDDDFLISPGLYNVIGELDLISGERVPVSVPIEIIPPPAITYYVNATEGSDDNDGLSSQTPFATIQKAIDSAGDGDTIEVWPGTYTGDGNRDIDFLGKAITVRSTDPNDPDIVASTIIDCNGTEAEPHRGFYFHSGEDANSVLNGLTITNGCSALGGGIYCENSSPKISNCIITNSYAIGYGGGMFNCENSCPTLINCSFISNRSSYHGRGGAMVNDKSSPTLLRCSFIANRGGNSAGAIQNTDSNAVLTNCTFTGNFAPIVCVCITGGGAINNRRGSLVMTNCAFTGNYAGFGGAVLNNESTSKIINCTFSDNFGGGNAIFNLGDCNTTVRSCILWDGGNEILGTPANITYSDVQGGWPGLGNIDMDPCFVGPAGYRHDNNTPADPTDDFWVDGDYHLLSNSPCIDAGDPCYIAEPDETDLDGNPRVIGGRIDMGAYEVTPLDLLIELSENLDAMSLPKGIANSLLAKLNAALEKLEDDNENNDAAAINLLEAFINTVQAQYDKKIPEAYADALIAAAQEIIELLSDG